MALLFALHFAFVFPVYKNLNSWSWSEVSGHRTHCLVAPPLELQPHHPRWQHLHSRQLMKRKKAIAKDTCAPPFKEDSWKQHCDTSSCIPFSRIKLYGMSSWKGRLGWGFFRVALCPALKSFTMEKERNDIGQQPAALAQLLSLLFQLSHLENKLCNHINFLFKTLKNLDFLSYWNNKMDMATYQVRAC